MKIEVKQFENITYAIAYPPNYEEGKKYPIIINLHGAGTRGNNIEAVTDGLYFKLAKERKDFPFITVAPQCSQNTWFDMFEQLQRLVCKTAKESFADRERIYLMGASMGGYGVWQLAMSMPEMFAAIVPICGGGMYWNAGRLINVPVWAFHGAKDDCVFPEESVKMVNAVNDCGGTAKLTMYPENGHDAWSDTYGNPEVFEWLLSHKNENQSNLTDNFNDSNIYG